MSATVVRRTFEAANHPKGSPERVKLNENAVTSEYYRSRRYSVLDGAGKYVTSTRTKAEAVARAEIWDRLVAER